MQIRKLILIKPENNVSNNNSVGHDNLKLVFLGYSVTRFGEISPIKQTFWPFLE